MAEYPDSWSRQKPKGYEPKFEEGFVENNGLALKIFSDFCCNGCSCKTENDHKFSE
jgi:hypothetical protein